MRSIISVLLRIAGLAALALFVGGACLGLQTPVISQPIAERPPPDAAVVATVRTRLNVREGPGLTFKVVGKLRKRAPVWKCEVSGDWFYVQADATEGWVFGGFAASTLLKPPFAAHPPCAPPGLQRVPRPSFTDRIKSGLRRTGAFPGQHDQIDTLSPWVLYIIGIDLLIVAAFALALSASVDPGSLPYLVHKGRRQSRGPYAWKTVRWVWHLTIALVLCAAGLFAPPEAELVQRDFTVAENDEGRTEPVDLYVRQTTYRINSWFPIRPKTRELIALSKDGQRRWKLSSEAQAKALELVDKTRLIPPWRYSQGLIALTLLFVLGLFDAYTALLLRDSIAFNQALNDNTFVAYREFLDRPSWVGRTPYYHRAARQRTAVLLTNYVLFLEQIALRVPDAQLKDWFVGILRELKIKRPTQVQVELTQTIDPESWRRSREAEIEKLNALIKDERLSDLRSRFEARRRRIDEELEFGRVYEIRHTLDERVTLALHEGIASTLTAIFGFLFGAKLIQFTTRSAPWALRVDYRVSQTPSLFYPIKQKQWRQKNRDWYVGARFDWTVDAVGPDVLRSRTRFNSLPAHQIPPDFSGAFSIFVGMAASAFASFGRDILAQSGLTGDAERWKSKARDGVEATRIRQAIHRLVEDIDRRAINDVLEDHRDTIDEFLSLLHAQFDVLAERLTNELP